MNIFRPMLAAVAALALAGCSSAPPMQAVAQSQPAKEMRVIVFPGGFNWPLWAGLSQGYFAREGLDVKTVNTPNSTFQLTGLAKGDFEIAMTAIDNIVAYREGQGAPGVDGSDLVAVMGADNGFLNGCRYLLHDRDGKFCNAFTGILEAVGIKAVKLPARSPNLNANLERWHRSLREECLSKLILFGEASLRAVLSNYVLHFHSERNHQGKGNVILFPRLEDRIGESTGQIQTRERMGGLLKFYHRQAA